MTGESHDHRESILPSRDELVAQLQGLGDRGVQIYLVYSAESAAYYNYLKTLRRPAQEWSLQGRVKVEHLLDSDHVFTLLCNQRKVISLIRDWVVDISSRAAQGEVRTTPKATLISARGSY
jgi:hypothetical protein